MTYYQTCRRHPEAGRFIAECYGCKRELFDMQARNEAEAAKQKTASVDARIALAAIGTDPSARILSVTTVGTALVIATEQASRYFRYAVDVFRLPTVDETDPDQDEPRQPGEWVLIDQYGDHAATDVPGMVRDAVGYLAELGITAESALVAA